MAIRAPMNQRPAPDVKSAGVETDEPKHEPQAALAPSTRPGGGVPLDPITRASVEPLFQQSFDDVRIHTGQQAAASARAIGALAYTMGRDIYFGQGRYAPGSGAGRQLLAHELTHVVQQSRGGPTAPEAMSRPGDASEREAERVSHEVAGQDGFSARAPAAAARISVAEAPRIARAKDDDVHFDFYQNAFYANRRFAQTMPAGWPYDLELRELWKAASAARKDEAAGWTRAEFQKFADRVRRYQMDVMGLPREEAIGVVGGKTMASLLAHPIRPRPVRTEETSSGKPAEHEGFPRFGIFADKPFVVPKIGESHFDYDAEIAKYDTPDAERDPEIGKLLAIARANKAVQDPSTAKETSSLGFGLAGYDYARAHEFEVTAGGRRAEDVMAYIQAHPNMIFPFSIVPRGAPLTNAERERVFIKNGVELDLVGPRAAILPKAVSWGMAKIGIDARSGVKVIEVTPTSFMFETLDGHFDGPGQRIRFSTYESGGHVYFLQRGYAPTAGTFAGTTAPAITGIPLVGVWSRQADELQKQTAPGSRYGGAGGAGGVD